MNEEMRVPGFARLERRISRARLAQLYVRLFDGLVRYVIWRHRRAPDDAQDLVQQAFLLALDKMISTRNARVWFTQTLDYLASNQQRKDARRAELLARWSPRKSR